MILQSCDIYRDGGSYGCVLAETDGHCIAIFLEVEPWDSPLEPRRYRCLWIQNGEIPGSDGLQIAIDTIEFLHWRNVLLSADATKADDNSRSRFLEMLAACSLEKAAN
jgi:hypothetical protein